LLGEEFFPFSSSPRAITALLITPTPFCSLFPRKNLPPFFPPVEPQIWLDIRQIPFPFPPPPLVEKKWRPFFLPLCLGAPDFLKINPPSFPFLSSVVGGPPLFPSTFPFPPEEKLSVTVLFFFFFSFFSTTPPAFSPPFFGGHLNLSQASLVRLFPLLSLPGKGQPSFLLFFFSFSYPLLVPSSTQNFLQS